ncbi:FMN-binding protein [Spongiimicrobium sp. 3-5]|uniref:FMN-binding protein n=1 Tax=Spongiimicrobium sp. 3-5 TaxID=3332596 RepID=UPI00397FB5F5
MQRGNNTIHIRMAVLVMAILYYSGIAAQISPRIQQKMDNAIAVAYETEHFTLKPVVVSAKMNKITPSEFGGDNLFAIRKEQRLIGFVYLGEAESMKRMFDYIVLFTQDWTIKKSKVLIYRENYGQQIGSQRWLKQFIGLTPENTLAYGTEIDAIAGATISASSMTNAIVDLLKSIKTLSLKNKLKIL